MRGGTGNVDDASDKELCLRLGWCWLRLLMLVLSAGRGREESKFDNQALAVGVGLYTSSGERERISERAVFGSFSCTHDVDPIAILESHRYEVVPYQGSTEARVAFHFCSTPCLYHIHVNRAQNNRCTFQKLY